jgi:PKD repeat protein
MKKSPIAFFSYGLVLTILLSYCRCQMGSDSSKSTLAASFTYSPASPVADQAVQFTDTSTGPPTSWKWNFGDGGTSTAQNPSHTFALTASYTVTLTVFNSSGSKSVGQTIDVLPSTTLAASFWYSPSSPTPGQSLQFTDTSTGPPTSWQWSFGDGGTSTVQSPSHTFAAAGSYVVTLTVTNPSGSKSTNETVTVAAGGTTYALPSGTWPNDRAITWHPGIWSGNTYVGIPTNYTLGITATSSPYNADSTGTNDATAAINSAIQACAMGHYVYLPAGSYRINGQINMKSGVSLVGAGAGNTILRVYSGSSDGYSAAINFNHPNTFSNADWANNRNTSGYNYGMTAGYGKGQSQITVSSGTNYSVGGSILIDENNDTDVGVTYHGYGGNCTWVGGGGTRGMSECRIITAKNGNVLTLNEPVYWNWRSNLSPTVMQVSSAPIKDAGVESLTLCFMVANESNWHNGVWFGAAYHCWAKKLEIYNWSNFAIRCSFGAVGNEITKCYFHDAAYFSGSEGYCVSCCDGASLNYVYDNIAYKPHVGFVTGSDGGADNVFAYNVVHQNVHSNAGWLINDIGSHGIHTYANLWEGNIDTKVMLDGYWGSGSHNVVFRSRILREANVTGIDNGMAACCDFTLNYYDSWVGNVIGYPGMSGAYEATPPSAAFEDGGGCIWYTGASGEGTATSQDAKTVSTQIRHGNYDYLTNATQWIDGQLQSLPPSFYLTSKPSWFGSCVWPCFGPDVSGYGTSNPAELRWLTYKSSGLLSDLFN